MKIVRQIRVLICLLFFSVIGISQVIYAQTAQEDEWEFAEDDEQDTSVLEELEFDEYSFEPIVVGSEPYLLSVEAFAGYTCKWESETEDIATVDEDGRVTAIKTGTATVIAHVTDEEGKEYTFRIPLRIVNPHLDIKTMNLASGCEGVLEIKECSGEAVQFTTSDKKKVKLVENEDGRIVVLAGKTLGTATITLVADGVSMSCKITVTNPKLKQEYYFYQKGKSFKLPVTGINKKSSLVWTTSNKKIAAVTKAGRIKTKKLGSAVISCEADGKTLVCYLAVAKKTVVKALRWGYKKVGKYHYSQSYRMKKNYFDCSSYVFRCYRAAGKYLVSKTSWAPVAADIGRYYVQKKRQVKANGSYYSESKLRPGDLICYGGKTAEKNGRYKRIYHIAIYIGNGKTMESSSESNNVVIRDRGRIEKKYAPVVVRPV